MKRAMRYLFVVIGFSSGFGIAYWGLETLESLLGQQLTVMQSTTITVLAGLLGAIVGYLIAPKLVRSLKQAAEKMEVTLTKIPIQEIIFGAIGVIVGLIIANLMSDALVRIPVVGIYLPTVGALILGYLGWSVGSNKVDDVIQLFHGLFRGGKERGYKGTTKVLDTSVIIDGRIVDITRTGFVEGTLVIPAFVLEELQHIADSSDILKRNRGRRGLDVLNIIQKEQRIPVIISERDYPGLTEVDSKLVQMAKEMNSTIITNDFNLNKVAELQGVPVLNINELANAVKPIVLPGEDMMVNLIKDGKEQGQGIAYLDDGTMIVVDGGKRYVGQDVEVTVTSVLQTAAGRMIFARLKSVDKVSVQGGS